jgi:glycogen operon protein
MITTLFLSQGVPMLVAGDEFGRTQQGNNNAYCQDNEISWLHWDKADSEFLEFTRNIIKLRKNHPSFCRRRWFQGQPIKGVGLEDIAWFLPDGSEMSEEHWNNDFAKSLAIFLNGRGLHAVGPKGQNIMDDSFYLIFNAHHEPLDFKLPVSKYGKSWDLVLDTSKSVAEELKFDAGAELTAEGRSIIILKHPILYGNTGGDSK